MEPREFSVLVFIFPQLKNSCLIIFLTQPRVESRFEMSQAVGQIVLNLSKRGI